MKLLIIDPNMTLASPSMKGVVRSLPLLQARGIETEVWCWTCDEHLPATVRKLPRIGSVRIIGGFIFPWLVFWRAWWLFKVHKQPRPDVIYSVAWYHKACDICHVHFSPFDWEQRQRLLGIHSLRTGLIETLRRKCNGAQATYRSCGCRAICAVAERYVGLRREWGDPSWRYRKCEC